LALVACQAATELPAEPSERVAPEVRETETEVVPVGDEPAPLDAMATTDTFYAWYLDYNDPEQGRNALVDGVYEQSPYLSAGLIEAVDAQLVQMREEYGGAGFDPFLMAQALPQGFTVEPWESEAEEACVIVHQQFGKSVHDLTVDLVLEKGAWKIDHIREGSRMTPEGITKLFLNDYLAQAHAAVESGEPGLLQSGAYGDSAWLNPAFAAEVEAELEAMHAGGGSGYDPILQAQAFPPDFTVEAGVQEGIVIVDMAFANEHRLEVRMAQVEGQWLVSGVTLLEVETPPTPAAAGPDTATWITVSDAQNGFSFRIPPDWVAEEQPLGGPGTPDDWPVRRQYLVMPATLA
jgi:hypothetical protein